jgi:hypothetical protein
LAKRKGGSLAFVMVLLALLVVIGCGGDVEEKMHADEIVQNALAAQAGIASSHMAANLVATVQGTLFGAPLSVSLNGGKASVDADWAHRKMKAGTELTVEYNAMPFPIKADLYAVDEYYYRPVPILENTDNWTKGLLPLDFWSILTDARRMNGLLNYVGSELVADEEVGGVDCNVLRLSPDLAAMQEALSQEYPAVGDIPDLAGLFDHLSILAWVARDTSFVTRIEVSATAHATAEALGRTPNSDALDINFTLTVEASGFNEPVSVELPAEAQTTP